MKTVTVRIDYDPDTKTYGATSEDLPDVYAISDDRDDVLCLAKLSCAQASADPLESASLPQTPAIRPPAS